MAITIEEFKKLSEGRKIYVFSTNLEGTGFVKVFQRLKLDIGGFIDSRIFSKYDKCGVPIIHPDLFFSSMTKDALVIIVAKHRQTRKWAIEQCEASGLLHNNTYFVSTDLCDYFPTIEVAGKCNLRCITCNMGVPSANKDGGYMSANDYRAVLEKMKNEIPFLNSVYMYTWGEPLLNPQIDEIISITSELGIAGEISTNLVIDPSIIERTIKANPDFLVVPCSGVGERFERTRTGGKWELFHSNLYKLREYIDHYGAETTVRIHYHMYRDNLDEDYNAIEQLCKELNFQFLPILAQIFPEYVLRNVMYNQPIPEQMLEADKLLYFPMENQLKYAKANKEKVCFMIKVFPVIRWDRTVIQCSNLSFPIVAHDYLQTPLKDLLIERERNGFCSKCMHEGMHRFFDISSSVKTIDGHRVIERD
jgi:MoaA/NifB/PqqE/SkfB family radical SAM enzyme